MFKIELAQQDSSIAMECKYYRQYLQIARGVILSGNKEHIMVNRYVLLIYRAKYAQMSNAS